MTIAQQIAYDIGSYRESELKTHLVISETIRWAELEAMGTKDPKEKEELLTTARVLREKGLIVPLKLRA